MGCSMRLCYGSFFRVLIKYLAEGLKIGEAKLNSEILSTYNTSFGSASGTLTTRLKACKSNTPTTAIDPQCWADNLSSNQNNSIAHFRNQIIPLLDSLDLVVAALLEIVQNDETIDDPTEIGWGQHQTKQRILQQKEFFLDEFLAGVYFYVLRIKNTNCAGFIDAIDEEFFAQVQKQGTQIIAHKTRGTDDVAPSSQPPEQLNRPVLPDGQNFAKKLQEMQDKLDVSTQTAMSLLEAASEKATWSSGRRRYGIFKWIRPNGSPDNLSNILREVERLISSAQLPKYKKALRLIVKARIENDGRYAEDELRLYLYRGLCYQGLLDFSGAAEAYETAALGDEYPWQIEVYEKTAELRLRLEDTNAAIDGLRKAAALYEKLALPEDQCAVDLYHNLATLLWDRESKAEARKWYGKEMDARYVLLPEEIRRKAEEFCAAGDEYVTEKRYNEAQSVFWSAVKLLVPFLSENHTWVADIYHKKLGDIYSKLWEYETDISMDIIGSIGDIALHEKTALGCIWKALQARERLLGDHWDTATALLDMGDAFYNCAMLRLAWAAEDAHISVKEMVSKFGGNRYFWLDYLATIEFVDGKNIDIGTPRNVEDVFKNARVCFREAGTHYLKALSMWEKLLGLTHLKVGELHLKLGQVYKYTYDTTKARKHLKQAFDIFDQNRSSKDKAYESLIHIGGTYHEESAHDIALRWRLRAYQYGVKYRVVPVGGYPLRQQLELSYDSTEISHEKPFNIWLAEQSNTLKDDWSE